MFINADVPSAGSWTHVGNPIKLSTRSPDVIRRPPPKMGEHTSEVLAEIGIVDSDLEGLSTTGVV
jgi:crotonobetainyl-CoA:carnitine CoA-transferase CaiB-like acyl-CoA transferase